MGNWHCVTSGCAEVVYREYSASVVRWRYPGENWQEIIGADDYSVKTDWQYETTNNFNYTFRAKARCSASSPPAGVAPNIPRNFVAGQEITIFTVGSYAGPIYEATQINDGSNVNINITFNERTGGNSTIADCAKRKIDQILYTRSASGAGIRLKNTPGSYSEPIVGGKIYDIEFIPTSTPPRACINKIVDSCTFTVNKKGAIVHQETRSICPEVEKLPCQLSDERKSRKVQKLPFLQRVEVVPYGYINTAPPNDPLVPDSGFADTYTIPSECLNIYRNFVTQSTNSTGSTEFFSVTLSDYITQICSAPGCLPPEYQVLCNCECEKCPSGTRPITCGSTICCYGSDGKAVKEIAPENYCGGDDCG